MAKNEKKKRASVGEGPKQILKTGTYYTIIGIALILVAIFLSLSPAEKAGVLGKITFQALSYLFGAGYYLAPILFFFLAIAFFRSIRPKIFASSIIGGILFLFSGLSLVNFFFPGQGGILGGGGAFILEKLFAKTFGEIAAFALLIISLLVIFDTHIPFGRLFQKLHLGKKENLESGSDKIEEYDEESNSNVNAPQEETEKFSAQENEEISIEPNAPSEKEPSGLFSFAKKPGQKILPLPRRIAYTPPPLELLARESGKPQAGDIKANANIIKRTLANFGVEVEMDEISIGPSITRYALKPAEGVKLSRIVGLQKELSLALAAHPLRIEAPIPGRSLVGIEIPNSIKTTVRLGSLLELTDFQESTKPLLIPLGRGVSGIAHFADLAKMPHLLIAGTTGSGKSVAIHALITSLLYRNSPENLRFIMIDPKRVELTLYNKITHLLTPVVTDPKKAIFSLKWAAKEMERRYDILEAEAVRDIHSYHANILAPALKNFEKKNGDLTPEERTALEAKLPEAMPYIIIVIDELADMMSSYPREMEAGIVRLAQMSRAVGIHLIISTQRPSTEVITGLIKANVPVRIALQVPSQIDSRTIIDMPGAEKLLGAGDMLYLSAESGKPQRIQSTFITEDEVKKVVQYLKENYPEEVPLEIDFTGNNGPNLDFESTNESDEEDDELYNEARETVVTLGKASTSLLQRKLRVGYARAARLLDILEERGIVGPGDGAKPREIYLKNNQVNYPPPEKQNEKEPDN